VQRCVQTVIVSPLLSCSTDHCVETGLAVALRFHLSLTRFHWFGERSRRTKRPFTLRVIRAYPPRTV